MSALQLRLPERMRSELLEKDTQEKCFFGRFIIRVIKPCRLCVREELFSPK